ncbi:MAG: hypothetical protein ACFFDT_03810 [Candidatus Hodarchaeota archaeon]
MRKFILVPWIVLIIGCSGLLFYSSIYEIDLYETLVNFKFQISDVNIIRNNTGEITTLHVSASIMNPSHFSSFTFLSIKGEVFLNGQESEYLRLVKWYSKTIHPREDKLITWSYEIFPQDIGLFIDANNTDTWNWYFSITIRLDASIVEEGLYDRSQPFQGVRIIDEGLIK